MVHEVIQVATFLVNFSNRTHRKPLLSNRQLLQHDVFHHREFRQTELEQLESGKKQVLYDLIDTYIRDAKARVAYAS